VQLLCFVTHLTWSKHIDEVSKKIPSAIIALRPMRPFISKETAIRIYRSLIEPHFDYCCPVWDGLNNQPDKSKNLQNRAARVITKSSFDSSASALLVSLGWDNLATRRTNLNQLAPNYLQTIFILRNTGYVLRNKNINQLLSQNLVCSFG